MSPELLHALRDLALAARKAAEDALAGPHASRRVGAGLEFSQYRPYQPGDDLRRLDWRLAARSDRYYLREADVDTTLTVQLVLDLSASLNHRDANGLSKLDYARLLLAALAYLAQRQGDAVGLTLLRADSLTRLPPRAEPGQLPRIYQALEKATAEGVFPEARTLAPLAARRQRALTVVVSDLYETEAGEIGQLLRRLQASAGEVLLLHLLAGNELTLSYPAGATLRDLETGQTAQLDAPAQRPAYLARLQAWLRDTAQTARRQGLDYHLLDTSQPLAPALRAFLRQRG